MDFAQARAEVGEALGVLASLTGEAESAALHAQIERLEARFVLAVVGEFSSGKSFLLNALLGKVAFAPGTSGTGRRIVGLLATDINPSTATITELSFARDERATAIYSDGSEERIPLDRLSRFVAVGGEAKIHDATAEGIAGFADRGAPTHVRVAVDSPFLESGFVVADTPGLASINPAHRRATLAYLPSADAVLYLIDTQTPFTDGDAAFLGIVRQYIESVFIVQTKIDLWRMPEGDSEAWESAYKRITSQTANHAPGTRVFPLSARDYADGVLSGDAGLIERSRFDPFLETLDASLIATSGRSRIRRAANRAKDAARTTIESLDALDAALALEPVALAERRSTNALALEKIREALQATHGAIEAAKAQVLQHVSLQAIAMREDLARTLAQTLDIADVARLRDRAKLHIIVDTAVATVVGAFAQTFAATVDAAIDARIDAGRSQLLDVLTRNLPDFSEIARTASISSVDVAAPAFGATAGVGTWAGELDAALRSTVVLGAIGGPAVAFVHGIAGRFAAEQSGRYMKRELIGDLRSTFLPALDADVERFVDRLMRSTNRAFRGLATAFEDLVERLDATALGELDRAAQLRSGGEKHSTLVEHAQRRDAIATELARIETAVEAFGARVLETDRRIEQAGAILAAHVEREPFDVAVYERGLAPTRYRVAVLGALRRGKSSLINAFANERVLTDEGETVSAFPVHVRYGPQHRAFSLDSGSAWSEIPYDTAGAASMHAPVLIEIPWKMPRELVLVHVPAFDSGDPYAEEIAVAAAHAANATLCLFSRQLSDRELALYQDVAQLGRPMFFVHTLADHETSGERRSVTELAQRYLGERGVVIDRLFTVSTTDYREAQDGRRAASPWNELGALIATLEARGEEHMAHLAQRDRALENIKNGRHVPIPADPKRGLFDRIFRRG